MGNNNNIYRPTAAGCNAYNNDAVRSFPIVNFETKSLRRSDGKISSFGLTRRQNRWLMIFGDNNVIYARPTAYNRTRNINKLILIIVTGARLLLINYARATLCAVGTSPVHTLPVADLWPR